MSTRDLHEYTPGQFQTITRLYQEPAGDDPKVILDAERVKLAGYDLELWSAATGGVQLIIGTDYTLQFRDDVASTTEGVDIYAGYLVINAAYQAVPLYLTGKIVGGYTFRPYRPAAVTVTGDTVLTMNTLTDMAVIADTTAGNITLTLPDIASDTLADNSQVTVIPKGSGVVTVTHSTMATNVTLTKQAGSFIYAAGWLPVGSAGGGGGGGMAIGEVVWWPGSGSPDASKLVCDGKIYNIEDYPSLFGKLGTLYGGDGVATFGVPNLSGITPGAFGTRDVNGRTKGDATAIGGIREDHFQGHWHSSDGQIFTSKNGSFGVAVGTDDGAYSDAVRSATSDGVNGTPRTGTYSRSTELVGRWVIQAYDTVQEVPGDPAIIKDWVLVYGGPPALTIPNAWGEGVFLVGFQYTYNAATIRSNIVMGILIDGFDRDILFDVDQAGGSSFIRGKYISATNSFTLQVGGTDFTNPLIRGIYKFDDAAPAEVVLNPPADGWETVFDVPTGQGNVPNLWGAGTYEVTLTGVPTANDNTSFNLNITEERLLSGVGLVNSAAMDSGTYVRFTVSTNNFTRVGSSGSIIKVRKFNGMLHVMHDYGNTIMEEYKTGDQHVTKWGGGRMEIMGFYVTQSPVAVTSTIGALFRTNAPVNGPNYAESFISPPTVLISTFLNTYNVFHLPVQTSNTANFQVAAYALQATTEVIAMYYHSVGRWK
jgi:hypothetical protein